jgi:hypothetical protein
MLGPLPLVTIRTIHIDALAAQHLAIVFGIVARLVSEHGPVGPMAPAAPVISTRSVCGLIMNALRLQTPSHVDLDAALGSGPAHGGRKVV